MRVMSQFEVIDDQAAPPAEPVEASAGPAAPANAGQGEEAGAEAGAEPLYRDELVTGAVEAVLFASDKPLSPIKIARALGLDEGGTARIEEAITELNQAYEASCRAFRIEQVAGGYRAMTLPEYAAAVASIRGMRDSGRLSPAALETLSIVAYRQPVTRVDIEGIRGVACGEVLRTLLERRLVEITGRAEELGRPMLYGTTKQFLEVFGLATIKDLPPVDDFFASSAIAPAPSDDATTSETLADETPADQGPAEEAPAETTPSDETPEAGLGTEGTPAQ